jgi:hypothetical protein
MDPLVERLGYFRSALREKLMPCYAGNGMFAEPAKLAYDTPSYSSTSATWIYR